MADELRLRALKHGRTAMARYRASKYKRLIGPANREETALFELICRDPADVSVAVAFGEVASVRSSTMMAIPGALAGTVAVQAARASLWAFDRAAPPAEVTAVGEPLSTEFVWLDEDALAPLPAGARAGGAANEAVQAYEDLVAREDRFGLANGGTAKERHDLVVATLRRQKNRRPA